MLAPARSYADTCQLHLTCACVCVLAGRKSQQSITKFSASSAQDPPTRVRVTVNRKMQRSNKNTSAPVGMWVQMLLTLVI